MKTEILNKLSKEGREKIIELEAKSRSNQEDLAELDLMLKHLEMKE